MLVVLAEQMERRPSEDGPTSIQLLHRLSRWVLRLVVKPLMIILVIGTTERSLVWVSSDILLFSHY